MVGYQEILSDPSYCAQMVNMTYPLIGNYGITDEDYETQRAHNRRASSCGNTTTSPPTSATPRTLAEVLRGKRHPGHRQAWTPAQIDPDAARRGQHARRFRRSGPREEALANPARLRPCRTTRLRASSGKKRVVLAHGQSPLQRGGGGLRHQAEHRPAAQPIGLQRHRGALRHPGGDDPRASSRTALFLSNGPGDPGGRDAGDRAGAPACAGKLPIFGICLGHQMIALAYGAKTYKMKFGHRGGNHPVKNLSTGKVEITCQNHSATPWMPDSPRGHRRCDADAHQPARSAPSRACGCAGDARLLSVQYHPESAPGPQDSDYLFGPLHRHAWRRDSRHA